MILWSLSTQKEILTDCLVSSENDDADDGDDSDEGDGAENDLSQGMRSRFERRNLF